MARGIVAENNSVCRCAGSFATILRMSWMKPISSIRSASSSTRNSTSPSRSALLVTRSSRRPGVATSTSTPFCTARTCAPIRHAADHQRGTGADVAAVSAEAVEDLPGQLPCRAQHQHTAGLARRARLHVGLNSFQCVLGDEECYLHRAVVSPKTHRPPRCVERAALVGKTQCHRCPFEALYGVRSRKQQPRAARAITWHY